MADTFFAARLEKSRTHSFVLLQQCFSRMETMSVEIFSLLLKHLSKDSFEGTQQLASLSLKYVQTLKMKGQLNCLITRMMQKYACNSHRIFSKNQHILVIKQCLWKSCVLQQLSYGVLSEVYLNADSSIALQRMLSTHNQILKH